MIIFSSCQHCYKPFKAACSHNQICPAALSQVFWCISVMVSGTVRRVCGSSRGRTWQRVTWSFPAAAWWRQSRTFSLKDTLSAHTHQPTTIHLPADDLIMLRCVYSTPACLPVLLLMIFFLFSYSWFSFFSVYWQHVKINCSSKRWFEGIFQVQ